MATKEDSSMDFHEIIIESEGSNSNSEWDDSEEDPDYDMLEETHRSFSNLSLKNKAKKRIVENMGMDSAINSEVLELNTPSVDGDSFEKVQKIIKAGLLEKLKVDECKIYLKKNGLRLTGNKDTLIQRIKEHQEIINGGGEKKYPPHSFVLNCKGDACTGDVVLFEQNVYEMFNIASRSGGGPPCGKRTVAGRIVKESYGAAKQQHTFTIEVLWSKGEKPLPPLHPLLIKGRNLYRLKTLRQKWEDEGQRQKLLMEKHSRGSVARADREARIQEKEMRKSMKENRISKKDSAKNQSQSHSSIVRPQIQPQETTNVLIIPPSAIVNKPAAVTEQPVRSIDSRAVTVGSDQFRNSGKPSFNSNHYYADYNYRDKPTTVERYHPSMVETNNFAERTFYPRKPLSSANHFVPRFANANHIHTVIPNRESYQQKQFCRHFARGRCHFGDNCKFLHGGRD
ncbi:zinc finger CCCH domain-containing protein 62-like [Trifolium pratense]|uniref:zinc finger CCCH domain-containing protein 62-like n=1 Tax=Trifolium pratense TaxID=57577 RepID=UPI001E6949B3|nr:zinc finger CCCH domain-containing protein 62-like [Trifolium pratense]